MSTSKKSKKSNEMKVSKQSSTKKGTKKEMKTSSIKAVKTSENKLKKTIKNSKVKSKEIKKTVKSPVKKREKKVSTPTELEVVEMSSQMLKSMNEKIDNLQQVKSSLEKKLSNLDSKVTSKEKIKQKSTKKVSSLTKLESQKELSEIKDSIGASQLVLENILKKLKTSSQHKVELDSLLLKIKQLNEQLSTSKITKTKLQTLLSQSFEIINEVISTIQHVSFSQKVNHSKTYASQKNVAEILEHKVDDSSLQNIIVPLQNRVDNCFKIIESTNHIDSKKFSKLKTTLQEQSKEVVSKLNHIEKIETEHISKTKFNTDLKQLKELIEGIETELKSSKYEVNDVEDKIDVLQKIIDSIERQMVEIKQSKTPVLKVEFESKLKVLQDEITNSFKSIEQLSHLEHKDYSKLIQALQKKFKSVDSQMKVAVENHTHFVTKEDMKLSILNISKQITEIINTLKRADSKEKSVEKEILGLENLVKKLKQKEQAFEKETTYNLSQIIDSNDVEKLISPINSKISNIYSLIEKVTGIENSKIKSLNVGVEKEISNLGNQITIKQNELNNHVSKIDSTILEVIETLKRASSKEKKLEKVVSVLSLEDKKNKEEIDVILSKFKGYYTKKYINSLVDKLNSDYKLISKQVSNLAKLNSNEFSILEKQLVAQKQVVEDEIQELDLVSHKEFASKKYTQNKIQKLKDLEDEYNQLQNKHIDSLQSNHLKSKKEVTNKINALKESIQDIIELSEHFMDKKEIEKIKKQLDTKIKKISLLEKKDFNISKTHLNNLAKTFAKEIASISETIKTLSTQKDVNQLKLQVRDTFSKVSKEIENTQKDLVQQSIQQYRKIEQEHSKLLKVKTDLESTIHTVENNIISNFATKDELSKINENLSNKLGSLEALHDQSIQLVEDELDDLFKQSLSHKKSLHALHAQLHKDEDIMGTHQEIVDVSNVLNEMLKQVEKSIFHKSSVEHKEFVEKVEALLETERERQDRLDELNKKVKKTYSQKQLDSAFEDVANEVERVKLHEEEVHNSIDNKIKSVLSKEKKDTKKINEKTHYLEEHTSIDYLKQQLTLKIEDEISKIKLDQESHMQQLLELQSDERRLDTVEDFMGIKEEELEKKLAIYYDDLEKAKTNWEEFFSSLKSEVEADEVSLHKAIKQIELLRSELKTNTEIISKYQTEQGPLKQYFVDKYNSIVDAFHEMQKETFDFQNQLKHSQEEKVAQYVNAFVQRVLDYEQKLKDAQEVISEFVDMKTSQMFTKFEGDLTQYKEFYGSELQSIQEKIVQYLKEIEDEKNTFSSLIKNYVVQIDSKISEVNDLEANLENTIKDAKIVINSYIDEKTQEIDSKFSTILSEKTDSFMKKEENLLTSYHEKISNLTNHVDEKLHSIEHQFIEKNTKKVTDAVENEFIKIKNLIKELKDIREEVFNKEQSVENILIEATTEFENKKESVIGSINDLAQEAKNHYINLEEESVKIKSEVFESAEERMTRFEQHLNKRYLETEEHITEIKRILVDEIEGFMKDISQKVQINERKIQTALQNPQQTLPGAPMQLENGTNSNYEVKFLEIENELKALKANQEGIVTEQVLNPKLDSIPQPPFKKEIQIDSNSSSVVALYDEVQSLKANLEVLNAQDAFKRENDLSENAIIEQLSQEIVQLKDEISSLKSQNEITSAQLVLEKELVDLPKSKRVDVLIDKVALIEGRQSQMKSDIEANSADLIFEHTNPRLNKIEKSQLILGDELKKLLDSQSEMKSEIDANSADLIFKHTTPRMDNIEKNQKILADEMKKAMVGVKEFQSKVSHEIRALKGHVDNLEKISVLENEIGSKELSFNSQDLVHNMKRYENNLMDLIYNLKDKGYDDSQIESVLFEKGHPQFYVQILLKHLD